MVLVFPWYFCCAVVDFLLFFWCVCVPDCPRFRNFVRQTSMRKFSIFACVLFLSVFSLAQESQIPLEATVGASGCSDCSGLRLSPVEPVVGAIDRQSLGDTGSPAAPRLCLNVREYVASWPGASDTVTWITVIPRAMRRPIV